MTQIEGVIFDLDGTLVCTKPYHWYGVVDKTLRTFGSSAPNGVVDRFWYEGNRNSIIRRDFGLDPVKFWHEYKKHDTVGARRESTFPYSDVSILSELKDYRFKTGIVTGAPPKIAALEIGMIGRNYFDAVVNQSVTGKKPKPDPSGLLECLKLLDIKPEHAVYIGNSEEDIQTARNAHVLDIYIDRKEHQLLKTEPSITISSLKDLRRLLGMYGSNLD